MRSGKSSTSTAFRSSKARGTAGPGKQFTWAIPKGNGVLGITDAENVSFYAGCCVNYVEAMSEDGQHVRVINGFIVTPPQDAIETPEDLEACISHYINESGMSATIAIDKYSFLPALIVHVPYDRQGSVGTWHLPQDKPFEGWRRRQSPRNVWDCPFLCPRIPAPDGYFPLPVGAEIPEGSLQWSDALGFWVELVDQSVRGVRHVHREGFVVVWKGSPE